MATPTMVFTEGDVFVTRSKSGKTYVWKVTVGGGTVLLEVNP